MIINNTIRLNDVQRTILWDLRQKDPGYETEITLSELEQLAEMLFFTEDAEIEQEIESILERAEQLWQA